MNNKMSSLTYKPKSLKETTTKHSEIPELVFANDGRQFFPCKYCCFAFADKVEQVQHMSVCDFKEEEPVAPVRPQPKARKSFAKPPEVQTPSLNGFIKPKPPKPKQINNNLITIKKPKTSFPKIKLNPVSVVKNAKFVEDVDDDASSSNVCMSCGEVLPNKMALIQHKKDKHAKIYVPTEALTEYDILFRRSDMTKCVICEKPVIKPQWARHLATHAEEKTFGCSFCSRKFRRKDQRNVHEKTHTV